MNENYAAVVAILQSRASFAAKSIVNAYLLDGRAEEVFPSRTVKRAQGRPLPRAVISYTRSEEDTREILDALGSDSSVASAYVAPERTSWTRKTQDRRGRTSPAKPGWHHEAIRVPANLPDTSSIRIGVIDSGVDDHHPAFEGLSIRKVTGPKHNDVDTEGHGTHVVGIIGGRSSQVPLRLCNAQLTMYKALGPYDPKTYYNMLSQALDECDVVNLSLGGPQDDLEEELLKIASEDGRVVVVAAMGNESDADGVQPCYPAALPDVVAVGACDHDLSHASFSNCGDHISLSAPGVQIHSAVPLNGSKLSRKKDYDCWDGTSMATPLVTAACAMLRARYPQVPAAEIRAKLMTRLGLGQLGRNAELGRGVLDLGATLS